MVPEPESIAYLRRIVIVAFPFRTPTFGPHERPAESQELG